jgi:hypothetical protein
MVIAQKCSEAPKMLNQASMLQHFLIPTASNGSPLAALLRRGFARGESSAQAEQRVRRERPWLENSRRLLPCQQAAPFVGILSKSVSEHQRDYRLQDRDSFASGSELRSDFKQNTQTGFTGSTG